MFDSIFFIQLVAALIGTLGFAIMFKIAPRHLPFVALGGEITFILYFVLEKLGLSLLLVAFGAMILGSIYSEICARVLKAPFIIFVWLCAVPIIPGSALYYTMSNIVTKNFPAALEYLSKLVNISLGISGGVVTVTIIFSVIQSYKKHKVISKK